MADATIGCRLGEDKWLVSNTLPFIFEHLDTPDLLRCSLVCKLWHEVTQNPICWKTVQFSNNCNVKIDISGLLYNLEAHKTLHLKMEKDYCVRKDRVNLTRATKLKTLEIRQCSTMMREAFLHAARQLESIKIEMIPGAVLHPFNIDFLAGMPHLRELRLSLTTETVQVRVFLFDVGDLRVLYILNVEDMFRESTKFIKFKRNELEVLALGNVGDMTESYIPSILQASPVLKKLRLECCSRWNPHNFFRAIGLMKNLTCLELLDFKISDGFENSVIFCPNIEELTIMPSVDRFYMGLLNARILMAAQNLGKNIKKFTLGFSKRYLLYMYDRVEQRNVIPLLRCYSGPIQRDPIFELSILLTMVEVEAELSILMPTAKVRVIELDYVGNIFK
ncbi:unnamed protein product [Ceutorhynchus assimilis]|uniref:F-box domain-containing protein n=1 Tax=Ceutorhynchus assimilis TaxID=467358 RepID=A0A9N9QKD7_9CUCU|nr:unnamed protein product [Ceutorhynchus assimilis]